MGVVGNLAATVAVADELQRPQNGAGMVPVAMRQYDGLNWPLHILDQSTSVKFFNSPIAKLYKIRVLPSNYLIDPQGVIVGVNLTPEAVEKTVMQ